MTESVPLDDLLAHRAWVRRLAHALVRDPHAAEDRAQEAWIAALEEHRHALAPLLAPARGPVLLAAGGRGRNAPESSWTSETTGRIHLSMSPRRSAQLARERLLDEGVRAFVLHGYHGTGIKQILDAVGVPKGSFYNYFASKEAFGAAVIEHYADAMAALLAETLAHAPSASAGLRSFFESDMRRLEEAGYVGGCLVANLGAEIEMSERCNTALRIALQRYIDGITGVVARAQREGDIRSDIPAAALAELLVDAWEGAVIRMKIQRSPAPLQDCLQLLLDGFFRP